MAPPPDSDFFDPEKVVERRQPCQNCIEQCIDDPDQFCANRLSDSSQQCWDCEENLTEKKGDCVPMPGLDMKAFLDARNMVRRYPRNRRAQKTFEEEGSNLQYAISKLIYTEPDEVNDAGEDKKGGLATRVAVLEAQMQTLADRVSQLEVPVSSPRRDSATQTSCLLPSQKETKADAAPETTRLEIGKPRKRAGGEVVGQGLPSPDSHVPTSSSGHPAKRKKQRKLLHN
ncbi:hypothetical protein GGR53DRAFT_476803, partial [Hypoxylon sp. FL1150]